MKTLLKILVTGFFALLPLLLIYLLLCQLFDMTMALTTPILDVLPENAFPLHRQLAAAVILFFLVVLVGLAALTKSGRRSGKWIETRALSRVPLYSMLRNLTLRLSGDENLTTFRPALVSTWPNTQAIAFVVEEHASGDYTVFMPISPTPSVGFVYVVGRAHVQVLDVPASNALSAVLSWGEGTEATVGQYRAKRPVSQEH